MSSVKFCEVVLSCLVIRKSVCHIIVCSEFCFLCGWLFLIFVFKLSDGIQNFISSLSDGESSLLPSAGSSLGSGGVDLADCEPGKGAEHEVKQVLSNVDHDVLVLEDSLLNNFPEKWEYIKIYMDRYLKENLILAYY